MSKQLVNYGKILSENIDLYGFQKKKIYELLKINPRTFDSRLEDGKFSQDQLRELRLKKYL